MATASRSSYDCRKCAAFCCSIYERVEVKPRDLKRLARHFGLTEDAARARFTRPYGDELVLRRKADPIFGRACKFLDPETRGCTIYDARPSVCREYPGRSRCAYFDVLRFERQVQGDPTVVPLVRLVFRAPPKKKAKRVE
jgi:Fe-S-cluster containining protein